DEILRQAVSSSFDAALFTGREAWQRAVRGSSVRLQWDPDHHPSGAKLGRRAIQLGLRGEVLARYAREWIVTIENISAFVAEQRQHVLAGRPERQCQRASIIRGLPQSRCRGGRTSRQ